MPLVTLDCFNFIGFPFDNCSGTRQDNHAVIDPQDSKMQTMDLKIQFKTSVDRKDNQQWTYEARLYGALICLSTKLMCFLLLTTRHEDGNFSIQPF